MKCCVTCQEVKTYDCFYKRASVKDGHGSQCKKCQGDYIREWKRNNRDKTAEQWKRYYAANTQKHLDKNAKWRQENPEANKDAVRRWERLNPDRVAAKTKRYRERHPEQFQKWQDGRRDSGRRRIANWVRRSAIRSQSITGHPLTPEALWNRFEVYGWRCRYCKVALTAKTCEGDHRIPISRGGLNCASNIVPACRKCNVSKLNKTEREYLTAIQLRAAKSLPATA